MKHGSLANAREGILGSKKGLNERVREGEHGYAVIQSFVRLSQEREIGRTV